jgi:hypothetical protein
MKSSFRKANKARSLRHFWLLTIAIVDVALSQHLVHAFSTRSLVVKPRRGKREGSSSTTTALALLENQNPYSEFSGLAGESALQQVQFLASKVAESTAAAERGTKRKTVSKDDSRFVRGTGGTIFNGRRLGGGKVMNKNNKNDNTLLQVSSDSTNSDQVWTALANLELDSTYIHIYIHARTK